MLKALIIASVFIGAFLFSPVYSQTAPNPTPETPFNPCPLGGTYQVNDGIHMCAVPARQGDLIEVYIMGFGGWDGTGQGITFSQAFNNAKNDMPNPYVHNDGSVTTTYSITGNPTSCPEGGFFSVPYSYQSIRNDIGTISSAGSANANVYCSVRGSQPVCPPEGVPNGTFETLYQLGDSYICYEPASDPSNDDDCPPETVGGCEPPDSECFTGGNGMEVCPSNPDEKCTSWVHEGKTFYDCEKNCGFIQESFFCTTQPNIPDLPDLSKCFKVGSGFACPPDSPTPDDALDNPEQPISSMVKGDFKQVNKGIETRLDATNDLLSNMAAVNAANNQALADMNAKQLASNGFLRDIKQNTAATAKGLEDLNNNLKGDALELPEDSPQSILSGLGLTGNEKISDLEKEVVSLDSYRDQFSWSVGSSSCPADRSLSMLGTSFTIAWQPYCDAFSVLGHFIQAAAFLLSGFIAFGVRK